MQQIVSIPGVGKTSVTGGVCCGVFLCLTSNFQQFGIQYTTIGKAGFITACYIIIVPILGLFFKKKCSPVIVGAVAPPTTGLYLLCMTGDDLLMNKGDLLMLVYATPFTVHIMIIDFFLPAVGRAKMSCIQFFVCGILSGVGMLLYEAPDMGQILVAQASVFYTGVMSCDVTHILQIIGQRRADPTVASLILSLESNISILAGWVVLNQKLMARELTGYVLMFAAIIFAQLPVGRESAAKTQEARRHTSKQADP